MHMRCEAKDEVLYDAWWNVRSYGVSYLSWVSLGRSRYDSEGCALGNLNQQGIDRCGQVLNALHYG